MPEDLIERFTSIIEKAAGMVLVTGPTGSGKTTTLYSALNELNDIETKIITTEDPIEYDIDGLIQIPVNPDIDVTFANVLRAILRHDPDKILVGEIRDYETAEIAIQSSLTGHLVFSTLHTNDAPSAITRLRDMGVPPFLITATAEAVLAQRLVRRICSECRTEFEPSDELLMELQLPIEQARRYKFYYGKGCPRCNNAGYKGRVGLYELIDINDDIRDLITSDASVDEMRNLARAQGMTTLREAGLKLIFDGVTTIDEVVRETVMEDIE
jgi:type IV pilus assembly protein PilB